MQKRSGSKHGWPRASGAQGKPPVADNLQLHKQTRKVLSKHYRAKYSMRQGRGGR